MDDRYSHEAENDLELTIHHESLVRFVDRCLSHNPYMWDEIWHEVRREATESVRKMQELFSKKRGEKKPFRSPELPLPEDE